MKYIQVKQVFISSVSGDCNLLDFLINENITIYILSTSENLIMKLESTYLLRYSQKAVSP